MVKLVLISVLCVVFVVLLLGVLVAGAVRKVVTAAGDAVVQLTAEAKQRGGIRLQDVYERFVVLLAGKGTPLLFRVAINQLVHRGLIRLSHQERTKLRVGSLQSETFDDCLVFVPTNAECMHRRIESVQQQARKIE